MTGVRRECMESRCFDDAAYEMRVRPWHVGVDYFGSRIVLACREHVESLSAGGSVEEVAGIDTSGFGGLTGARPPVFITPVDGEPVTVTAASIAANQLTTGSVQARHLATGPVKTAPGYRPTKWSTPWLLLIPLFGWELWTVITGKPGGPLSHLAWWAYGERYSLQWWVVAQMMNGLGLWAAVHFMFEWPDWRHLLMILAAGAVTGLLGWGVTLWVLR